MVDCLKNNIICLVIHLHIYYTVVQTLSLFSFYYGFCKCSAVVIIFGARYTELLCNTTVIDLPTSPTCFCYTTMGKINLLFWDELKRFVSPCQSTELLLLKSSPLTSTWPHLRCDVGLVEGEYWKKNSVTVLCTIIMVHKGTSRSYRLVNYRVYWALIFLGIALYSEHLCVCGLRGAIFKIFLLTSFS